MLSKVCRTNGHFEPLDEKLLSDDYQHSLGEFYQKFNVACHCTSNEPVIMHIRKRQESGLMHLADNPTSPKHHDNCRFYTSRRELESLHDNQVAWRDFSVTETFQEVAETGGIAPLKSKSSAPSRSPRKMMTSLENLFVTMVTHAFLSHTFGKYVSFRDFVEKIKSSSKNKGILSGDGSPLLDCIYYGVQGVEFAKSKAQRGGMAIWIGYLDDVNELDSSVVIGGNKYSVGVTIRPYKCDGLHVVIGTLVKGVDSDFNKLLAIPCVSKDIFMPVHNELQRVMILELQKWLFGRNKSKTNRYYISKPLIPIIDDGHKLLPSLVVVEKDKANHSKKQLVICNARQSEQLASVYDAETLIESRESVERIKDHFKMH